MAAARGARRGGAGNAALGVGLALLGLALAAAVVVPRWVRERAIEEAARQGVVLEVRGVGLGFPTVRLVGVRATLRDVPGLEVTADVARVTLQGLAPRQVALEDARVTLDGSLAGRAEAVERAIGSAPPRGADAIAFTLRGEGTWRGVLGPGTTATGWIIARATGPVFEATVTEIKLATGAHAMGPWRAEVATGPGASRLALVLDRSGSAKVELARTRDGGRFALEVPRTSPGAMGVPAQALGLAGATEVEAHVAGAMTGPTTFDGTAAASVYKLSAGLLTTDAHLSAAVRGDARGPMRLTRGTLSLGPLRAEAGGTFELLAPLGARLALAFRAGPIACPFLPGPSILRGSLRVDTSQDEPLVVAVEEAAVCGVAVR